MKNVKFPLFMGGFSLDFGKNSRCPKNWKITINYEITFISETKKCCIVQISCALYLKNSNMLCAISNKKNIHFSPYLIKKKHKNIHTFFYLSTLELSMYSIFYSSYFDSSLINIHFCEVGAAKYYI